MADEGGVKKYSEKLFKRVKVSRYLKIHIGIYHNRIYVFTETIHILLSIFYELFVYSVYCVT